MKMSTTFTARIASAALMAACFALPAYADGIMIKDAYARAASPTAKSGAAFMQIMNHAGADDRLISASSDVAARVELHTHKDMGDGVMKMMEVEEGFAVPAGGMHALARGGDHVMLMGLTKSLNQGDEISVTLTFEKAGDMVVAIPVDNERQDAHGMKHGMDHGEMDHGNMDHGKKGHEGMDHSGHTMKKDSDS